MKLKELKKNVDNFLRKEKKGKQLDPDSVKQVLEKLEKKQKRVNEEHKQETSAEDGSAKEIKRLELQQKVIKAQMEKARKILEDLEQS